LIAAAGLLAAQAGALGAQQAHSYPNRPVRLIVPYPPGGSTDILGRLMATKVSEAVGQQFVVDNRGGAGGNTGSELAARQAPDGYTLLVGTNGPIAISPHVYRTLKYDPLKDLQPVTLYAIIPYSIQVHPSVKASNLVELIALAKAQPGKLNYASSGSAGTPHLCIELLRSLAGIDLVHVPYKGGGPATQSLLSGESQIFCPGLPPTLGHIKAGRIRVLAVTTAERSRFLPEASTGVEQGFPALEVASWVGWLAPAATPRAIVDKLHATIARLLAQPEVQAALEKLGVQAVTYGPEEFARFLASESARWAKVAKFANIKLD
jgi:tripartite-type tricarboxylate transporter receptor subunit TctC